MEEAQGREQGSGRPLADQYVSGFVEAPRQKIFVGLSIAGTQLLGPFAINNFFQDRVLLG